MFLLIYLVYLTKVQFKNINQLLKKLPNFRNLKLLLRQKQQEPNMMVADPSCNLF